MSPKKQIESTNPEIVNLIRILRTQSGRNKAAIWRDVAEDLSQPKRKRTAVNLSRISRYTDKGDEVVVPGKVIGSGLLDHPVKVAAFGFSEQAKAKITRAKGKCLTIPNLMKTNPKGSNVKIIR